MIFPIVSRRAPARRPAGAGIFKDYQLPAPPVQPDVPGLSEDNSWVNDVQNFPVQSSQGLNPQRPYDPVIDGPAAPQGPVAPKAPSVDPVQAAGNVTGMVFGHEAANAINNLLTPASSTAPAVAAGAPATPVVMGASGINGVSAAAGRGGPALATAAEPTSFLGTALPWLGVAGMAGTTGIASANAWNAGKGQGAKGGLEEGVRAAGPLNFVPLLGQAPWAAGLLSGFLSGHKHKDQIARDAGRQSLKDRKFLSDDNKVTLADGSMFDIGKDGGSRAYNVDQSTPLAAKVVAFIDPLADLLFAGDPKMRSDFAGYLANAAMSSGDPIANIRKFYENNGLDWGSAKDQIRQMYEQKQGLDPERQNVYYNSVDELFGKGAYEGKQPNLSVMPVVPDPKPVTTAAPATGPAPIVQPAKTKPWLKAAPAVKQPPFGIGRK